MATVSEALTLALQHHQAGRLQAAEQIYRQILDVDPNQPDAWHLLGLLAHAAGEHDIAIEYIGNAIRLSGEQAFFHTNLGVVYRALKRWPEAMACYQRALQLAPDSPEALDNLGAVWQDQGRLDEASACYRRALQLKPDYAEGHANLGTALQNQGRLDEAVVCYQRALQLSPDLAEAHFHLGTIWQHQGRLGEASAAYQRAVHLQPNAARGHFNLGTVWQSQGRMEDALASYQRALQLNPEFAEALINLGTVWQALGRIEEAIDCLQKALQQNPDYVEAHVNLGIVCQKQGRLDEAIAFYQQALQRRPDYAEVHNNLGTARQKQGKLDDAIASFQRALELQPDSAQTLNNLGTAWKSQGKIDEAIACYQRALQRNPEYAEAHYNLGNACKSRDRLDEAIACYQRALQVKPGYAEAHYNLGNAWKSQGKLEEAIVCYQQAIHWKADYPEAHYNLGTAWRDQGRLDEAIACYQCALQLQPDYADAHNNLGNLWQDQGRLNEASACYQRALQANPEFAEAHNNLGTVWKNQRRFADAIASFQRALWLKPDYAEAHYNLGSTWQDQENLDEAIAAYQRAVEIKPGYLAALGGLIHQQQLACRWNDLENLSARVIDAVMKRSAQTCADPVAPFTFLALPVATTAAQQLQAAQLWVGRHVRANSEPLCAGRSAALSGSKSRITLGYLSADFHSHATAWLIAELFEKHDRGRFAVFGYSYGPDDRSPMRRRLVEGFDRFADLRDVSFTESARRIAADEVDILIDLKGYTGDTRTPILAFRPAPIQVNYLGYPGTMGAPFMDYLLVDEFVVPPDQQPFFSEHLVHLPGCYQVNDSRREIAERTPARRECGLPEQGFVFCCFNNNYKITRAVFTVWLRLLQANPGSVLWLLEGNRYAPANLRREAEAQGIPAERLVFAPRRPLAEHLARHRVADLFLDTLPVNAHTTASDALWAGCPVLTVSGETFVARVAGSLLRALGLPELITTSLDEYEKTALRLAQDAGLLAELRARLAANRQTSGLFDAGAFARHLEEAYHTMWTIHQAGAAPRPFAVQL